MLIRVLSESYLKIILLNGLIVAIIKFLNISLPTSPINIITAFFVPFFLYQFVKSKKSLTKIFITLFIIFGVLKFFILKHYNLTDSFDLFHLTLALTSFNYFFNLEQEKKIKILFLFKKFTLFFVFVFFVQYFFRDILPKAFTDVPNLFKEIGVEKYTVEINLKQLYRPNGLIGNPITFGFVLNLLLAIELFYVRVVKSTIKSRIIIITLLFMIFFLFSRANIILALIITSLSLIKRENVLKISLILSFLIVLIFPINKFLYSSVTEYRYNIDRITGKDFRAQKSTDEHIKDYIKAYNTFLKKPILGSSAKEMKDKQIITDGAVPYLILTHGAGGFLFFLIAYFSILKSFLKQLINDQIIFPLFIITLLIFPYSILNSAILNKGVFLIIFSFFGVTSNLILKK